jgi:hypothetical protein
MVYGGLGLIALALVIIFIVAIGGEGKKPAPPKPPVSHPRIFNPYLLSEAPPS